MKVEFKNSFSKDLKKLKDEKLKNQVRELIELTEQVQNLQQLENIKKLRGTDRYYRIKLGDYRIGLILESGTLIFVRFLHRKDIYRYFP